MTGSILTCARTWAAKQAPADRPDATLRFFKEPRLNNTLRKTYLSEAGCVTGLEECHHGKQTLNAAIARTLQREMRAENAPGGKSPAPPEEFIDGYQRFLPG